MFGVFYGPRFKPIIVFRGIGRIVVNLRLIAANAVPRLGSQS